jgi:hypothetical protein
VALSLGSSLLLGESPAYDEDGTAIVAWYVDNGSRFLVLHFIAGLVFLVFYIPFLAGLIGRLQEGEGPYPIWSRVAFTGGILCPAVGSARGLFASAPALLDGNLSPEAASFAMAAAAYGLIVSGAMSGILTGAAAIVILSTRVFSPWLGWLAVVAAVTALVSLAAIIERDPDGPLALLSSIAWIIFFVWIAAVSVALIRSSAGARPFSE